MMKIKPRYKVALLVAALGVAIYASLICARVIMYSGGSFSGLGSVLGRATAKGDGTVFRLALLAGADPGREVPAHIHPPLVTAASKGEVKFVRLLLDAGADPEGSGLRYNRPIFIAITSGEEDVAALLRERGAEYDIVDAIFSGDETYARQWVDDGGDVRAIAFFKGNLLHAAVEYRNVEAARLLLELGMDPTIGGTEWMSHSPLEAAREIEWLPYPVIAELVALFEAHIAAQEAEGADAP